MELAVWWSLFYEVQFTFIRNWRLLFRRDVELNYLATIPPSFTLPEPPHNVCFVIIVTPPLVFPVSIYSKTSARDRGGTWLWSREKNEWLQSIFQEKEELVFDWFWEKFLRGCDWEYKGETPQSSSPFYSLGLDLAVRREVWWSVGGLLLPINRLKKSRCDLECCQSHYENWRDMTQIRDVNVEFLDGYTRTQKVIQEGCCPIFLWVGLYFLFGNVLKPRFLVEPVW